MGALARPGNPGFIAAMALAALSLGAPASAQIEGGPAAVSGSVVDEKGYPLRDVIVSADPAADTTDQEGRFGPAKALPVALRRGRAPSAPGLRLAGSSLRFAGLPRGTTLRVDLLLASGRRAGASAAVPAPAGRADLDLGALSAGPPREGLYVLRVDDGQSVAHHLLARTGGGSWVLSSQGDAAPAASSLSGPTGSRALRKGAAAADRTVTLRKPGYLNLTVPVPEGGDLGRVTLKLDTNAAVFEAPIDMGPLWSPSGWAGDVRGIRFQEEKALTRPDDPDARCQKWSFAPTAAKDDPGRRTPPGWAAVLWQYPEDNWGAQPGRRVTGASKVVFWARGEKGGEALDFKTGSDTYYQPPEPGLYKDSFGSAIRATLTAEWKRYEIPLEGMRTEQVISSFVWAAGAGNAPVTFWLDELRFE